MLAVTGPPDEGRGTHPWQAAGAACDLHDICTVATYAYMDLALLRDKMHMTMDGDYRVSRAHMHL